MARYGYNWQIPWRTAVPGYQEFLLKFYHQLTVMAANLQDLIRTEDSLVSKDYGQGTVKGYMINRFKLQEHVQDRLNSWSLLNSTYTTATSLTGSLGAQNIAPGYLFIKANFADGKSIIFFDNGEGKLTVNQNSVGTVNYKTGTYVIDETKFDLTDATDFQIGYSTGAPVYATKVTGITTVTTGYKPKTVAIKTAGTGYAAKDVVTLPDGSTVEVTTVTDGVPATLTLLTTEVSKEDTAGDVTTTGGTGTGLVVTVTTEDVTADLMTITGAIPGTAAGIPSASIYYTTTTDKVYVSYTTSDISILQEIYNNLVTY